MIFHYNINDKWNKLTLKHILEERSNGRIVGTFDCECGTTGYKGIIARVAHGKIKSCGCEAGLKCDTNYSKYHIGQIWDKLKLIKILDEKNKHGQTLGLFVCNCGKEETCPITKVSQRDNNACSVCLKELRNKYNIDVGQKFGKLTILKKCDENLKTTKTKWLCKCDCGNERVITYWELARPEKRYRRGCHECCKIYLRQARDKSVGTLSGSYWHTVKKNAYFRNYEFTITMEEVWNLYLKQNKKCAISGLDITLECRTKQTSQTGSLDRIDSDKGYTKDNIQWVHKDINKMKLNKSDKDFINICHIISDYQRSKLMST